VTRVAVVGGGIAGLACAYELRKGGAEVVVYERDRLGGVIRTERHGDLLIEGGPDSFITMKPAGKDLCEELGLGAELIPTGSRKVHLWTGGRLHEMPEGLHLTVPTKWGPFLTTGILSLAGKLRMGLDLVLPRGPEVEDESIGSFIRRRLGNEALEKVAEPIMAGIYVAPADELSLKATFPRFMDLEREHRSLIKAFRRTPPPSGTVSPFLSLKGGMKTLVDRLVERTPGAAFREGVEVRALESAEGRWRIRSADGDDVADAVVLAVPSKAAKALVPAAPEVRAVSTTTVSLCYKRFAVPEGTGFVIPRKEGRKILACTWTSNKFAGRCPDDRFLVRAFIRGSCSDAAATAHAELKELMGVREEPVFARAFAWEERNPVYEVGHVRKVAEAEARLPKGIHLCGSSFHGTGIPDCVKDGRATASRILKA
jgi:oxygen-dependent protoporphyrinogen oxidase